MHDTSHGNSLSRSSLAMTRPSPPLLPLPATTRTPRFAKWGQRFRMTSTTLCPARSISVRLGTPWVSMVRWSRRRISAAVTTRMGQRPGDPAAVMRAFISFTAWSIPTMMARATMLCPMLSSTISSMAAMGVTLPVSRPWPP